ncbi:hypothetical protein VTJ49DRAFT_697 [Mycothermus thermophilus]|uniref:F-box domain-containing protein n=1 Tax=Humicola insolens TaxID=85995 RepID=A0ABR3VEP1_HUMIN
MEKSPSAMARDPPTFLTLPLELRLEIYSYLLVLPPPPPPETQQPIYRCSRVFTSSTSHQCNRRILDDAKLHPQILAVNSQTYREAAPLLYTRNTFSPTWMFLAGRVILLRYYYPATQSQRRFLLGPATPPQEQKQAGHHHHHQQQQQQHQCYYTHTPYRLLDSLHTRQLDLIRRWHVPVCLDTSSSAVAKLKNAVARYLSGAEEVTLEVWRGRAGGPGGAGRGGAGGGGFVDDGTAGDEVLAPEMLRRFEHVRRVRRARIVGDDGRGGLTKDGAVMVLGGMEGYVNWLERIMMSAEIVEEECAWDGDRKEVGWMSGETMREMLMAGV